MALGKWVYCRIRFVAFHCWPYAPDEVAYLRNSHRHEFHVDCTWEVTKDREIEFCSKKKEVEDYITQRFRNKNIGTMSCEQIAEELLDKFLCSIVSVEEDGENGAFVRV